MFALDTNTLIYYFKGVGNVAQHFLATAPQDMAISSIVLYEMEFGIAKSANAGKRRKDLDVLLELIRVLPFETRAAKIASDLRQQLEKKGEIIGPHDLLIAATASAFGATLVTHNTREFSRISHLHLADWY